MWRDRRPMKRGWISCLVKVSILHLGTDRLLLGPWQCLLFSVRILSACTTAVTAREQGGLKLKHDFTKQGRWKSIINVRIIQLWGMVGKETAQSLFSRILMTQLDKALSSLVWLHSLSCFETEGGLESSESLYNLNYSVFPWLQTLAINGISYLEWL